MLNLVKNWRYVGGFTKLTVGLMNIMGIVAALFIILSYNQPIDSDFTRFDLFARLLQMQVIFNVPLFIVLNFSGLLRRTTHERHNTDDE